MDSIIVFLYKYGLIAVCIIIMIEYACFPVSSEIVLPLSGVIAKINSINLIVLIALSTIFGVIGSSICYIIGRKVGDKCIRFITTKVPSTKKYFIFDEIFI